MRRQDFRIKQGDDVQILIEVEVPNPDDPEQPFRLTLDAATKVRFVAVQANGTAAWKLTTESPPPAGWTKAIDALSPQTGTNQGRALIVIPRASTEALAVPATLKYDVEVEESNGRRTTTQEGQIRVVEDYS